MQSMVVGMKALLRLFLYVLLVAFIARDVYILNPTFHNNLGVFYSVLIGIAVVMFLLVFVRSYRGWVHAKKNLKDTPMAIKFINSFLGFVLLLLLVGGDLYTLGLHGKIDAAYIIIISKFMWAFGIFFAIILIVLFYRFQVVDIIVSQKKFHKKSDSHK